jgi:hypothetical protein
VRDVVGTDLDPALDKLRGIAQEAMGDPDVRFFAGDQDRVSAEAHVGAGVPGDLAEEATLGT